MITEYGNRKPSGRGDGDLADDGDVASPAYALQTAAKSVLLLGHGASGLLFWQLQEFNWNKRSHGMLSESGQRHPVAHAMAALFGPVPPGARVVGPAQPSGLLHTVALQSAERSYLMVVNRSDAAQDWEARLAGGHRQCNRVAGVSAYPAAADGKPVLRDLSVQGCVLKARVPAGTVATVTLE